MGKSKKLLALILTVLTVMGAFSVATPVVAVDLQSAVSEKNVPADEDKVTEESVFAGEDAVFEEADNEPTVIGEDESRRTADTKHFIMSDGTRKAVIYGNAVHYEENGKWQEIDNTLTYDKEKKEYKNTKNSFKATFKEDFGEENLFTLENEGYTISWEYEVGALRKALTKAEYKEKEKSQDKITKYAEKSEDRIKYKNFESDCELEYVVTDNGVKENIILNSKTNKNEFAFNVTAEGLTLTKNEDGSISAKNADGKEIFFIPAPFMYDSKDVYSYDVSYEIEEKNGKYIITVVADKAWLKDGERAYPVVIDPVIRTKQTTTSVSSTFVTSAVPTANYGSRQDIYIGHESANYGTCYAMFKNTLPTLNKGDMVVGAYLNLWLYNTSFDGGSNSRQLDAHIITSTWAENSVTWNTKPSYNGVITDYMFMENGYNNWLSLDITKAVKCWYEGTLTNYGILIKENDESLTPARGIFRSENATSVTEGIPYIAIDYRNNKGVESYWSYSSFSNGVGGTASINDYTGNLVYTLPLTSSVSEIMPVSLSLVYNTYCSSETYTAGKNNSNLTSVGKGWRLNYQQTLLTSTKYGLSGEDAENYPYVYTDGDGTEHYIAKFTENGQTVYKDEDGLGYTFSKPGGTTDFYRLTQDDGSYMSFNNCGNLSQIVDNSGNKITITYDSTNLMIQKITDGTGHTFTLNYTSGTNYLYNIVDNAGRTTRTCVYTNGILTDVILNDGSRVYFRYYSTEDNPLYYVWNTDGIGRSFVYTSLTTGRRVNKTMDFSADDVSLSNYLLGQVTTFDHSLYNTTTIRTPGIDGIHITTNDSNKSDDIVTTLQFDNFGRTVSQQVSYGNAIEVGAGSYTYTGNDEEESRHKIASSATLNKNTANMLLNPSAETMSNWNLIGKAGNVVYTQGSSADEAYYGTKSIKITNTSLSQDSFVHIGQRATGFKVGSYYTFSAYTKTNITNTYNYTNLQGAYLKVVHRNSSGTAIDVKTSPVVKSTTPEDIDNGWRRISICFKIPENTTYLDVYVMFGNATGTAYFDGMQLEESTVAHAVNLLENSSFEKYSSTAITSWTPTEGVTYSYHYRGASANAYRNGSASLKIVPKATDYVGFYQFVPVSPNPNDTYIVSGWAEACAVNHTYHPNAKFEIAARVTYTCSDGSTVTQYKKSAEFNTTVQTWQYASSAFSLAYKKESGDTKTYTPTHIMVMPRYNLQANYAFFDHIQLIKDVASSYIYDSEGNVTSVSANAEQKNNMTYDGEDLKTYTDAAKQTTSYTYDAKHRLTQVKSPKEVKQNYTYNTANGLVTAVETVGTGGETTRSTTTYTNAYTSGNTSLSAGAYVYQTTNELGKTTTYGHYLPTGEPSSVTDANGNKTTYTYTDDKQTKLSGVSGKPVASENNYTNVNYTYEGNRVSQILFSGTDGKKETYSFDYDNFGNVEKTFVGTKVLITNAYNSNNGLLQKSTYANGDAIRYDYNSAGLVKGVFQDNNATSPSHTFSWEYSSNGTPLFHGDYVTGLRYNYNYDSIGRLIRTNISDGANSYIGSTEYGYDLRNNLTSITNDIGGVSFTQLYGYGETSVEGSAENAKDNLPTRYALLGVNTDYYYNNLNQLTKREVGISNNPITNSYTYKMNGTLYTNQLAIEDIEGTAYSYEYDDVGNITIVKRRIGAGAETAFRSYTYDGLNRMTSETNGISNFKSTYKYDSLGNITEKLNTLSGVNKSKVDYTYSSSSATGWNYLLTKLTFTDYTNNTTREENIYYDAIGNPYSYRGAIMGWYGRQLKTYEKNGVTATLFYNADGLRTLKIFNGVKTEYQYVGDKLFYEKRGDGNSFYYFYDSYGKLSAIYHYVNGTRVPYHVVTNAQGDVMALYNWSGTKVAEYSYDAWGNCSILSDSTSTGIATLNPFRYRSYYYDSDLGLYYLQSRYYDSEIGRFINADNVAYLGVDGTPSSYNIFGYCTNNPVNKIDTNGHAPKWWQSILIGVAVIAVVSLVTAAIVTSCGTAAPLLAVAKTVAVGALKIAATSGAVSGAIRAGKALGDGQSDVKELGKDFVVGFADGFKAGSLYSAGCTGTSMASYEISGQFNHGRGWSSGQWEGGYQTPNTPGISFATKHGGRNGGRSFGVDVDIYNGAHYHTNKFGTGKRSDWIKAHHWEAGAIFVGVAVGFSEAESEW